MRRILLTYLLSVRERVVAGQERYFREIVAEMGGEEGEFLEAFNLGQVWWEKNGDDGRGGGRVREEPLRRGAWAARAVPLVRARVGCRVDAVGRRSLLSGSTGRTLKEVIGRERRIASTRGSADYGGNKGGGDGLGVVPLGESTRGNIGGRAKGKARRLTFG